MPSSFVITDLETAPLPDVESLLPTFKPNGNIKDEALKASNVEEKRTKAIADAALDPDMCRIVYLGAWWEGDAHPWLIPCLDEDDERAVLIDLWHAWEKDRPQFLGYNILSFDMRILVRRSLYLGVRVPPIRRGKYRHEDVCDLWWLLSEEGALPWRSLDYFHRRLGCPPVADTITGADVPACVARGEWDKVRAHLLSDLLRVRDVARRMGVLTADAVPA
jgi:Predicted 3'-5' exonuclease related to the exonuclease domain of PolB